MKNLTATPCLFLAIFLLLVGVGHAEQHDKLVPLLIDQEGWQAPPAQGMSLVSAQMKMINASRTYRQTDKNMTVNLMVNSGPVLDSDLQQFSSDDEATRVQSRQIDGFWTKATHLKKTNTGQVIVYLDYTPEASAVLFAEYANMNEEEALQLVRNLDWQKLKKVVSAML